MFEGQSRLQRGWPVQFTQLLFDSLSGHHDHYSSNISTQLDLSAVKTLQEPLKSLIGNIVLLRHTVYVPQQWIMYCQTWRQRVCVFYRCCSRMLTCLLFTVPKLSANIADRQWSYATFWPMSSVDHPCRPMTTLTNFIASCRCNIQSRVHFCSCYKQTVCMMFIYEERSVVSWTATSYIWPVSNAKIWKYTNLTSRRRENQINTAWTNSMQCSLHLAYS